MKNFRKIVAVLAAVLMFCSLIPMNVFAVDGDAVWSIDFNDGEKKFSAGEIVAEGPDGSNCLKWSANGNYSATWVSVKGIKANTDYTATFMAKASTNGSMGYTLEHGNWGPYWNGPAFEVTTEWKEVVVTFNSGDFTNEYGAILFKFQDVTQAMDLYVDDLVISEGLPELPLITNGGFEDGNVAPWTVHQQVTVEAAAAHDGSYGAHLKDNGTWGGIMDQTLSVEAGKSYELSFWIKVNKFGLNLQIKDGGVGGANLASDTWYDYEHHSEWTQKTYIVTPSTNAIFLNFCGGGFENPDPAMETDTYIDSFTVKELKAPSFDGYITNGDFETGDTQSWDPVWWAQNISLVEGGHNSDYAMGVSCTGQWQVIRQKVNVKPNTDYVFSVYAKDNNGMVLLVKDGNDDKNLNQGSIATGSEWKKNSIEFNSGSWSQVYVALMSNNAGDSVVVDDFFMYEKQPASNDGYLINGTFETGDIAPWYNLWNSCPKAEVVRGGKDDNFSLDVVSGEWQHVRQVNVAVEPNTDYKITLWGKNTKNMTLLVKGLSAPETGHGNGVETGNIANVTINGGDEWTENVVEFNSGNHNYVLVSFMGGAAEAYGSFDNIVMEKVAPACEHEYFSPCEQYCMICGELTNPEASHNIVHVEAVAPTCTAMGNIEFWYCDVCGMAWLNAECTMNTNMMAVKLPMAEHVYDDCSDLECNACGNTREFGHNLQYTPAKDAIDCANPGNIENWFCSNCGEYYADANAQMILNPWFINITVDCVRPEGVADCAIVTCETCGNEIYGYGEHDVLACKGGVCSKCNVEIEGYGCANYDTPACEDGVCYYCGDFVAGFGHENGAWAPCQVGECAYGCGLTYPATAEHVDEDGDDYCDTCWSHLAHIDEDGDGWCDICWSEMPEEPVVEIVYGDADGDGEVTLTDAALLGQWLAGYDVTMNEAAADADGDGEVTLTDAALLGQWLAGYDVTLGPAKIFNDAELGGW